MSELDKTAKVEFWVHDEQNQLAMRRMYHIPRVGDMCVFNEIVRPVLSIVWCLDEDATEKGVKVQIALDDEV